MKKWICIVLAIVMLLALAACGGSSNETKAPETKAPETAAPETAAPDLNLGKDPAAIESAIASALGEGYLCTVTLSEEELFSSPLGWVEDLSILDAWVAKQAAVSAVNPDNVAVVRCKDAAAADAVVQAFNNCFAQQVSYSRMYAFSIPKVEGCRIYRVDNLVMYILAGSSDESGDQEAAAKLAASEYQKIDLAIEAIFGFLPENLAVIPEEGETSGLDGVPAVGFGSVQGNDGSNQD